MVLELGQRVHRHSSRIGTAAAFAAVRPRRRIVGRAAALCLPFGASCPILPGGAGIAMLGLTKVRSMGPVADAVERAGGNVARVFRHADLPLQLIDQPDQLIPLRDQLCLVEHAAREIGDPALSARLSLECGIAGLGLYGQRVSSAARLDAAISWANVLISSLLQSSTHLQLTVRGGLAKWSYAVTDACIVGRQKNEILALGYMLDLGRQFMGPSWAPTRGVVSGSMLQARTALEMTLGADLSLDAVAGLCFPASQLATPNPARSACPNDGCGDNVLIADDFLACVEHLIELKLLENRPSIDWISHRLGLSRRSFQRRLSERGITFDAVMRRTLERRAEALLASADRSISQVAYELGYADPAHFARAFLAWKGMSPRAWRRGLRGGASARTVLH
ncbi:AraC family transcriptional regulator [Vineibacter terrae]|uniref:AraC family transcriptional regulator n=1 Tax=Vineibacter terrae TaxID=2586908 RepID=UPI002E300110|nr:AraC family transcriptional regulator ligand-binding domain-containing protein [Vineibacter terrae]HEX2890915.1 AraC family transcriptional regulator ligand-binding domain-containing protein [Vineibacter terrae]